MRLIKAFILLLFILISACRPEDNSPIAVQEQYWAEIYVRYLASDQAYKAELTLLAGDSLHTALPSRIEGDILMGNRPLNPRQLSGELVRYQLDYQGAFLPELVLNFKTGAFDRKRLDLSFRALPAFQVLDQHISRSQGGQITLAEAIQLKPDESILILISDAEKQTASIELPGPANINTIPIRADLLGALQNTGTGNVYLLSKKKGTVIDKDAAWGFVLEYYTDEQQLEIVE
ncbi:MAG TPA: hypothetical protein VJ953_12165 [Saprospiraceae bacterium]|nr:hypothetical protein [Saprospiraceae bacterium]